MTVEHTSPVEQYFHPNQKEAVALSQLKEITGVEDVTILGQALEASKTEAGKYDLSRAVNLLVEENSRYFQNKPQQCCSPKMRHNTPNEGAVIDLTNDPKEKEDDLQKAIALSLQEQQGVLGGQVTAEEQDISRVLEASLAESKAAGTKRKRGEVWQDPINPHERKRNGDWPVGLKNVGNTCWFSAVIQSLFHLPVFRHLVLKFTPQKDWDSDVRNTSERRNILFMQELRKLFALMIGTNRKYVDPSQALEVLKEAFPNSGGTDSQQDVSEFSHKLLEWLEDAFKLDSARPSVAEDGQSREEGIKGKSSNPMLNLFYGHFRSEGSNEGHTFSNEEPFGQYPLQVNGFDDIHESLEAAMAQEIETDSIDAMHKSGQETWFTQLPPVLLFELSRFQFNQQLGRPEKIHNKLNFPEVIYMDRYMECNKNITRHKREEVGKLKDERSKLQTELEKYLNFGSGPKRVPLQIVLQYTLEFVENKPTTSNTLSADVEMASPASTSSMATDSPCSSPHKASTPDNHGGQASQQAPSLQLLNTPLHHSHVPMDKSPVGPTFAKNTPSPRHISEMEFSVIQDCLRRWRTEVEKDVKELQDHIGNIDNTIREIYNEPSLQQVPYRLHAVLVHEGQAASGHYWAYIYNPHRSSWFKFNDVTVTEASWSELLKESVGGHHHASAYCLMYVDKRRPELFGEGKNDERIFNPTLHTLVKDLRQYVEMDNEKFLEELAQWDAEQSKKKDVSTMTNFVGSGEPECCSTSEKPPVIPSGLQMEHAVLVCKETTAQMKAVSGVVHEKGPEVGLEEALRLELTRVESVACETNLLRDPRLNHIGVYMLMNGASIQPYLRLALLEQFASSDGEDDTDTSLQLCQEARRKLAEFQKRLNPGEQKEYLQWHQDYNTFRKLVTCFVMGVESFHSKRFQEALPYLVNACNLNSSLISKMPSKCRGLQARLVSHYRRICLLQLNKIASEKFESPDMKTACEGLQIMDDYVLPTIVGLSSDSNMEDNATVEEIRSRWCTMLGEEIASQKQEKLQDFLTKLLDPSMDLQLELKPTIRRICDLESRYHKVLALVLKSGQLEAALKKC